MKLKIKTEQFKEMVAKAAKGASEHKLLPITSMIAIQLKDNVLTLTTTDTNNTLKIVADKIDGEDFYTVVPVQIFSKLVAKTTAETITLTCKEDSLEVKGDGTYNIPLQVDEEGVIQFPEYTFKKVGKGRAINLTTIKNILAINKPSIAKNLDVPPLCGYYFGDKAVTTDENVICINDINVLGETVLIAPQMLELLSLNTQEKIVFFHSGDYVLFETPNVIVHGAVHDGADLYPAEEIYGYLDENFPSMCKVPKLLLQNVIDRLSLFIEPYDKNGAYLTFTKEGIKVSSKKSSSVETIAYQESKDFSPFVCCVDVPMLKTQIDATPGETIELWYGHDAAIKLVADKVTQVISLLEDGSLSGAADGE